MIEILTGQIAKTTENAVIVLVGGVGLRVNVPRTVLQSIDGVGHAITLYTYLKVSEDALALYGFLTEEDRAIFETLLTVSGVGPKLALSVLSTLTIDHLRSAIGREESDILTRVPGIGKKTAEKIVFELKGKLAGGTAPALAGLSDADTDVLGALTALGYSIVEAQTALQSIPRDAPKDFDSRLRLALQYFS